MVNGYVYATTIPGCRRIATMAILRAFGVRDHIETTEQNGTVRISVPDQHIDMVRKVINRCTKCEV